MRIIRRLAAIILGLVLLLCAAADAWSQTATVTLGNQKQCIRGFGGMTSDATDSKAGDAPDARGRADRKALGAPRCESI